MNTTNAAGMPLRPFGKTGEQVSLLGLGGFHIGVPPEDEAIRLMHAAFDAGVTFLDNAWEYNSGISEVRMGKAIRTWGKRDQLFVMTKDCAHDRKAKNSLLKLEQSLQRLQVDYLDLWQIHEVVWEDDPDWIFAPGGSAEALLKAKEQGKVRYIGFTGHKHPDIFKRMLSHGFPWDACQMPLNVLDAHYASFEREILPICQEQGIAVIAMKSLADGHLLHSGANVTPAEALRYTMSLPVATVVSGIDSMEVLEKNVATARNFTPLTDEERADILARTAAVARDGKFEPFKTTRDYDANEGRLAHDYPLKGAAD
ncbi:MAG TPA: aldo/keto reductase [Thermomicrobiales bacterium]|jgi:predicted aldo/keto reductase-like oxidoreductase